MAKPRGWPPRRNGMPSLEHLDSRNSLNQLLNMLFGGRGAISVPKGQALLTNLTRLSDKAVLEYEAARAALDRYVSRETGTGFGDLFRAFDHLETCIDAVWRAGRHAEALRALPGGPRITRGQLPSETGQQRLRDVRNSLQHGERDVLKGKTGSGTGRPATLIATEGGIVAGQSGLYVRYTWLAVWITLHHDLVRDLISRRKVML